MDGWMDLVHLVHRVLLKPSSVLWGKWGKWGTLAAAIPRTMEEPWETTGNPGNK